jgi:hypothetical protein
MKYKTYTLLPCEESTYHTDGVVILCSDEVLVDEKSQKIEDKRNLVNAVKPLLELAKRSDTLLQDAEEEIKTDFGMAHKFSTINGLDIYIDKKYIFSPKIKLFAGHSENVPVKIELNGKFIGAVASIIIPEALKEQTKSAEALLYD